MLAKKGPTTNIGIHSNTQHKKYTFNFWKILLRHEKELRNGYKISNLDIYANIHECTKLHKHKLIQGRHSLRNAAPKCSLRSPMSRNVCFKHVQHPMKSVLSNFNYHSSQTSNEILPLKLQSNILHPMRILLSFAQKVLAQIS